MQISSELRHSFKAEPGCLQLCLGFHLLFAWGPKISGKQSLGYFQISPEHGSSPGHVLFTLDVLVYEGTLISPRIFLLSLLLCRLFLCPRQLWVVCVFKCFHQVIPILLLSSEEDIKQVSFVNPSPEILPGLKINHTFPPKKESKGAAKGNGEKES